MPLNNTYLLLPSVVEVRHLTWTSVGRRRVINCFSLGAKGGSQQLVPRLFSQGQQCPQDSVLPPSTDGHSASSWTHPDISRCFSCSHLPGLLCHVIFHWSSIGTILGSRTYNFLMEWHYSIGQSLFTCFKNGYWLFWNHFQQELCLYK